MWRTTWTRSPNAPCSSAASPKARPAWRPSGPRSANIPRTRWMAAVTSRRCRPLWQRSASQCGRPSAARTNWAISTRPTCSRDFPRGCKSAWGPWSPTRKQSAEGLLGPPPYEGEECRREASNLHSLYGNQVLNLICPRYVTSGACDSTPLQISALPAKGAGSPHQLLQRLQLSRVPVKRLAHPRLLMAGEGPDVRLIRLAEAAAEGFLLRHAQVPAQRRGTGEVEGDDVQRDLAFLHVLAQGDEALVVGVAGDGQVGGGKAFERRRGAGKDQALLLGLQADVATAAGLRLQRAADLHQNDLHAFELVDVFPQPGRGDADAVVVEVGGIDDAHGRQRRQLSCGADEGKAGAHA